MHFNYESIKLRFETSIPHLTRAEDLVKLPNEKFEKDVNVQIQCEHLFEILTQAVYSIYEHIIAGLNLKTQNSDFLRLNILSKEIIITKELEKNILDLLKMRNFVIFTRIHPHKSQHEELDYNDLRISLKLLIKHFKTFQRQVLEYFQSVN
ncbi:MAG: HepT-like ribonuclease domain-containing protein [Candidatus Ranarchaeia archaeon]